ARTGPAAVAKPASRHAARTARPCDAGHAHRLRFTPRRVARPHAGVYPAAKGTLGDRRSCREGESCPDGAHPAVGQVRGRCVDHSRRHYRGSCIQSVASPARRPNVFRRTTTYEELDDAHFFFPSCCSSTTESKNAIELKNFDSV